MSTQQTESAQQKTVDDLLYSTSAAARILGINYQDIQKLDVTHDGILVKVIGKRLMIISKDIFKQHFVDWRKSRTDELIAVQDTKIPSAWDVYNPEKQTWHRVHCHADKITCTCGDWDNQKRLLPMACCKHTYKVLEILGFGSLRDYLDIGKAA